MLSKEQNALIEKIALDKGFENFSVSVEDGSKKGDNYLGDIFLMTLKERDGSKEESLVLKCALKNEKVRAAIPVGSCYQREVYLYDTVLPAFQELQEKYALPHMFKAFAKMYGFSLKEGEEWLLMENITIRGFNMLDRKVPMDAQHVQIVLRELAKLHSLSFVMKNLEPDQYQKLAENLENVFKNSTAFNDSWLEGIKKKFDDVYEAIEDDEVAIQGLKKCENSIKSAFEDVEDEKYNFVITHGDSWCNNMMFKYGDTDNPTKPIELCFLDWQISKLSTPVADLSYYMFLSASEKALDNHKTYLRQYYQVLQENLQAVELQVDSVFSYSVFEEHWKKFTKIGLYIAMTMMDLLLKDEEDARTFSDLAEDNKDVIRAFVGQSVGHTQQYSNRIKSIILMLVENKYV